MEEFSGVIQVVLSLTGLILTIVIPIMIILTYVRVRRIENWLRHQTRLLEQLGKRLEP